MSSIAAAFAANLAIAIAKFVAASVTGSASMLAEAVHSVADTGNQALLLLGRHRARRDPNGRHQFGFGRERYFWSFVVAVVLFSLGSLYALGEGLQKLRSPHSLTSYPWTLGVLLLSMVFESFSLRTAMREGRSRKKPGETWRQFVRRTTVPETAVIILEDSGALAGLLLALIGTTTAEITGVSRFDAIGSLGIGLLLAGIAYTLATEMKSMLIGESAAADDLQRICEVIQGDPATQALDEVRTELLGPDELLVVGTVALVAESAEDLEQATARIEQRIRDAVGKARLIYLRVRPDD
jgi:cation diffusion facilitator family transporter